MATTRPVGQMGAARLPRAPRPPAVRLDGNCGLWAARADERRAIAHLDSRQRNCVLVCELGSLAQKWSVKSSGRGETRARISLNRNLAAAATGINSNQLESASLLRPNSAQSASSRGQQMPKQRPPFRPSFEIRWPNECEMMNQTRDQGEPAASSPSSASLRLVVFECASEQQKLRSTSFDIAHANSALAHSFENGAQLPFSTHPLFLSSSPLFVSYNNARSSSCSDTNEQNPSF